MKAREKQHALTVYPSKPWTSIDVPIGLEKGTVWVSEDTLKRFAARAHRKHEALIRAQRKQKKKKTKVHHFWRTENGEIAKMFIVAAISIVLVAILGEGIRVARQVYYYGHHQPAEYVTEEVESCV